MRILFFLLFLLPFLSPAQVTDDFSDGDFTANPAWSGNSPSQFEVNTSNQLHLNSLGSDTSSLVTASSYAMDAEWRFWIKLSFATSANNNARFYLVSDQANIEGPLNGYFVQIGETNDSIALFRQSGTALTKIISGTIGYTNNTTNTLRIKVTRDLSGNWQLSTDPTGGTAYQPDGTAFDNTFTTSAFMGVWCKYTSSNATRFYFDDIYAGPIVVDVTPPSIVNADAVTNTQLDVLFNEVVDISTSQNVSNYSVNNGIGTPVAAVRDAGNGALVHLTFMNPFVDGLPDTLTVTGVSDLAGNGIASESVSFFYHVPMSYEIVINEIMADPDPAVGLPNYEYIELSNRTHFPYKIDNWQIVVGSNIKVIPSYTIPPDSFVVLTSATAAPAFGPNVPVLAVPSFPSLNNSGHTIILKTNTGAQVSTITYSDSWYKDESKKGGGWSLEQIDPSKPCEGSSNWKVSNDPSGGTPGRSNSVFAYHQDASGPQVIRIGYVAADTIEVYFSEPVDTATMLNLSIYNIDNGIGNPTYIDPAQPDFTNIKMALPVPMQPGIIYTMTISTNTITDCVGNFITTGNTGRFAVPGPAASGDIIINEILADPLDGGVDFVELYNRSQKVIDLKSLTVSTQDTITGTLLEVESISNASFLIFPGEYYVLSEDGAAIRDQYDHPGARAFIDVDDMPAMNIDGDVVVIANAAGSIIDKFAYTEEMHFPLLNDTKGVSLERIDFERTTQDATNWHSAAESAGFATPGYRNSQYNEASSAEDEVSVSPEIFSPDNDSYNDIVNIRYKFDLPGMVANVNIYDPRGRLVRTLVQNELLGTSGTFSWDGIDDSREKARIGIYIIYFEAFDTRGNLKHYKKTCVLGGKL